MFYINQFNMKKLLFILGLFFSLQGYSQSCAVAGSSTVTFNSYTSVTISFSQVMTNVTAIQIYYVKTGNTDTVSTTPSLSTAVSITGLTANQSYSYQIRTFCSSGGFQSTSTRTFSTTQTPVIYTPMTANGYSYKRTANDSSFHVPFVSDTLLYRGLTRPGAIVCLTTDSLFYGWNGRKWALMGADVASLVAKINTKVDSVTIAGDSLFYWINGVNYGNVLGELTTFVKYTDSTLLYVTPQQLLDSLNVFAGGINIGNSNLRLDSDRKLSGGAGASNGYSFTYDSLASFNLTRKSDGLDYFYVGQDGEFIIKNILNESFKVDSYGGVLMQSANNAEDDMPTRVTLSAQQDTATFTFSSTTKIKAEKVNPNNGSSYKLVALNDATKEFETVASLNVDTTNRTTGIRSNARAIGDSTVLSAAINAKPNFGDIRDITEDTANVLRAKILADSIQAASVSAGKVNIADTASMLSGYRNASIFNAGTVADARLSSNVALKNIDNSFTANQTISKTNPQFFVKDELNEYSSFSRTSSLKETFGEAQVLQAGGGVTRAIVPSATTTSISVPSTGISGSWTVAFWHFTSSSGGNAVLFGVGENTVTTGYSLTYAATSTRYTVINGGGGNILNGIAINTWYHILIQYNSSTNIINTYINGTLITAMSSPLAANPNVTITSPSAFFLAKPTTGSGSTQNTTTQYAFDQFLIYNKIVNTSEISQIYNFGTGVGSSSLPTSGLVRLINFDETTYTGSAAETSGVAGGPYNATITNGATSTASGKAPADGSLILSKFFSVRNPVVQNAEVGEATWGNVDAGTVVSGKSVRIKVGENYPLWFTNDGRVQFNRTQLNVLPSTLNSGIVVLDNVSIGANVAAPTNGLLVAGNTGLAGITSVTAKVHIAAGSTSAGSAPIKLTSSAGAVMSTPEAGAVEFDGTNYFVTSSTTRFTLAKTLTATATLDFPNTSGGDQSDLTVSLTNAAVGDVVMLGIPVGSASDGVFFAFVSSANTITVRFLNHKGTAHDPASGTFRVSIIKY